MSHLGASGRVRIISRHCPSSGSKTGRQQRSGRMWRRLQRSGRVDVKVASSMTGERRWRVRWPATHRRRVGRRRLERLDRARTITSHRGARACAGHLWARQTTNREGEGEGAVLWGVCEAGGGDEDLRRRRREGRGRGGGESMCATASPLSGAARLRVGPRGELERRDARAPDRHQWDVSSPT